VSPIQCPIEKRIEGVNDRARVTASLRLEQLLADQSVNFTIAYFKREAVRAFPPPLSVRPRAFGSRQLGLRHWCLTLSV
jgi:hypothetical protein